MAMPLRADTITEVTIGPAVAVADGFTPVTGLTIAGADEAEIIKHGATAATSITGTLAAITGADGYYALNLVVGDVDTEGRLVLLINDDSLILPIRHEFVVLNANVFDSLYGAAGTDVLDVNLAQWLGTAPLALLAQRVQGQVGAMAAAVLTAAATAPDHIDLIWDEILTGATHNVVDSGGRRLRVLEENGSYNGFIWIDTVNGSAGTTDFENGTDHNPVNNLADANTLAASIGLSRFKIAPGSSLTFVATQSGQVFIGSEWTLALGGQDISGTSIAGAMLSGIATAAGTQFFVDCIVGAVTLPDDTHVMTSGIVGVQTLPAGDVFYDRCHSGVVGTGAPLFDFGAVPLNTNLHIRNYSGGVDVRNMGQAGVDDATIEGRGQVIVNVNCVGGTIEIRGNFQLTDNGSAAITDVARYDSVSLIDGVWDEDIVAAHATADTAGLFQKETRQAVASIFATVSDAGPLAGDFDTGLTEASDDHYNGMWLLFLTGPLTGQAREIRDYTGASKNVLFDRPFTEAPANGNAFVVLAVPAGAVEAMTARFADIELAVPAAGRHVYESLARLRNKVDAAASPMIVYEEDDVTSLWTQTFVTDVAAVHIKTFG